MTPQSLAGNPRRTPVVDVVERVRAAVVNIHSERTVRGPVMVNFQPNAASQVQLLSDRAHRPYPAEDIEDAHAVLLEREADDAAPIIVSR